MFRKYEKTFRILVPQVNVKGKHFLSQKELQGLLNGKVTITEKLDGANTGIIRTKDWFRLQKRGSLVDASEHEQFNFFKAWADTHCESLLKIPKNFRVYGELMRCVHTIHYQHLPDWFLVFAVYDDDKSRYLPWPQVEDLCNVLGLCTVPLVALDTYVEKLDIFDLIPNPSAYADGPAEGVVVWNYRKQLRGKLVREAFVKHMDESVHWTSQKMQHNRVV